MFDLRREYFSESAGTDYDFSEAPVFVGLAGKDGVVNRIATQGGYARWESAQSAFMDWTKDERVFDRAYVQKGKDIFDLFFADRGLLQGNVLDVGGGWGLFRQWWEGSGELVYICHDPGVERFRKGPHSLHRELYRHAFTQKMTFVEGFGENMPYRDCVFDTGIIAATLDHCFNPGKVIAEMCRCIKNNGTILIVQHCEAGTSPVIARSRLHSRLKLLLHPKELIRKIFLRLLHPDRHLHHFLKKDIYGFLNAAGFDGIREKEINDAGLYAFEAKKLS